MAGGGREAGTPQPEDGVGLDALGECLLVQCGERHACTAAAAADRYGSGLVVTGLGAPAAIAQLRQEVRFGGPVLADAERYKGARRAFAADPFSPRWIESQRELRLPVLTDSGYIAEGDDAGLASVLDRAGELGGDVIAALPVASWWLRGGQGGLGVLVRRVTAAGVPVALILEHRDDPLSAARAVRGLLALLAAPVEVFLLRCDISAIGALCCGAKAAAVGATSGLRHLYPQGPRGPVGGPKVAAVVKHCLAYVAVDRIAFAVQHDPDDQMWVCECLTCSGRTLDWLATTGGQGESAAFAHSVEVLLDLRDELFKTGMDSASRQASWLAKCADAEFRHDAIKPRPWQPPRFLDAWRSALAGASLRRRLS